MTHDQVVRWSIALGIALGVWLIGAVLRPLLLGLLTRAARRTTTELDEHLLAAIRPHIPFWFLAAGVTLGMRYGDPGATAVAWTDRIVIAGVLASVTLAVGAFAARLTATFAKRFSGGDAPATTLTQNAARIVVIGLGALMILGHLGIQIAPLLAALGVGSLAVALALQPTLANLFAGFLVSLAGRIRVGDFVELENGQQGFIVDIGWRSTQIRELPNNIVLVPNSKLADMIVKNFGLPEREQSALVQVGVSYGSDLAQVERVTIATAKEVQTAVTGAVPEFDPFIRFHTFGDSSINFSVIMRVKEFTDRYLVTHEFIKRLHVRYAEEGIEIPFPQRVVHLPVPLPAREG